MEKQPFQIEEIITANLEKNVVLLIGPMNVGKTVVFLRLLHYIEKIKNYSFKPNIHFRKDANYINTISGFLTDYYFDMTPPRTGYANFCVLDIFKEDALFCQVLDKNFDYLQQEGDFYFPYFSQILNNTRINKLFILFFEDIANQQGPYYYTYLENLISKININDKVLILYNKIDLQKDSYHNVRSNQKEFFEHFKENNSNRKIIEFLNEINISYDFIAFSSGIFTHILKKPFSKWTMGSDEYPIMLLEKINKAFK